MDRPAEPQPGRPRRRQERQQDHEGADRIDPAWRPRFHPLEGAFVSRSRILGVRTMMVSTGVRTSSGNVTTRPSSVASVFKNSGAPKRRASKETNALGSLMGVPGLRTCKKAREGFSLRVETPQGWGGTGPRLVA